MTTELVGLDPENWRAFTALEVLPERRAAVSDPVGILARAWAYRSEDAQVWGILAGGEPAGLLSERSASAAVGPLRVFDEFLVDRRFQGRGLGSAVLVRRVAELTEQGWRHFGLCYVDRFPGLGRFYGRLGFCPRGVREGDEIILQLDV